MIALDQTATPWVRLALVAVALAGLVGLVVTWRRRQPAVPHSALYARGRLWLSTVAVALVTALLGAGSAELTDRLGTPGLLVVVLLLTGMLVAVNAAHPRLLGWARRRLPAKPATRTRDGGEPAGDDRGR